MIQESLMVKAQEVYKAPYIEVYRNVEKNIITYKWIGKIHDVDGKNGMLIILELIKKHKVKGLIADLTSFLGGSVKIGKWINEEWSQMLYDAGLRNVAVRLPLSVFDDFSNTVALGLKFVSLLKVEKFIGIEDAYHWIGRNS